jgi:hypothetical protein
MDSPNETTTDNQPVEADNSVGGMDAIRNAIKASLEPKEKEPAQPDEAPEATEQDIPTYEPPEAETQPDEDDVQDDSGDDIGYRKRIDKLTWQKKELQEELEETRRKLYEQQQSAPKTTPETPNGISDLVNQADTYERLEQLEEEARQAERWAKRSLARYRRDPDSVEQEIENKIGSIPDDVEEWLEDLSLNAEFSRESDIPKRRKAIEQQKQSFEFAATKYPWLKDPQNPARAWVEQVKEANPGIKNLPDVDLYLARALVGFYIEQEQQAKPKTVKTPDPTSQPRKPAASAVTVSESLKKVQEAKSSVMKTGSIDGLKSWIKAAANAR